MSDEARSSAEVTIGIDVGGTFTDIVLVERASGRIVAEKVLSIPEDLAASILDALDKLLGKDIAAALTDARIVHATTLATNALLQHRTPKVGLITNTGFRDVLEIRRHWRPDLYDLKLRLPPPLVSRDMRLEVDGRIAADGSVVTPLDETGVAEVLRRLREKGAVSYAICFIHSYVNLAEEERAAAIVKREHPDAYVTCSAAVCPEYREYERTSTAAVNAAVMPLVDRYLNELEERLESVGYRRDLYIMQASGGMMTAPEIRRFPVNIIESGPAAGVVAALEISRLTGRGNALSFDMGGTTAKASLIHDGEIELSNEYEVGGSAHGARPGGGYAIRLPTMDIVEVGAGGGSIAWIDEAGGLRVGPISAGADPGPVCYGRGGIEPTTTDANLVLGRLSVDYFLGGEISLDIASARRSIERKIAQPLSMSVIDAASGIIEVSNSHMVRALRRVSVEKGHHPRDYTLVAFGGAGPLHACYLAEDLDVGNVIVPLHPGVASAVGLLGCDMNHEYRQAYLSPLSAADPVAITDTLLNMANQGRQLLREAGFADDRIRTVPAVDLRYEGQAYELRVALPALPVTAETLDAVARQFHADHMRLYAFELSDRALELVGLRTGVVGVVDRTPPPPLAAAHSDPRPKTRRAVHFRAIGSIDCAVYERTALLPGQGFVGPAVVEQKDSTTLLPPGWALRVDEFGHLILQRGGGC